MNRNKFNSSNHIYSHYLILLVITCIFILSHQPLAQSQEEVIYFDSNTNDISEDSQEVLNSTAESLKDVTEYVIRLEGYSDITGRAEYNLDLSKKRAQLVKDYLVEQGLSSSSIEVVGMGGTEKYGAGETNEALEQNRRVNLIVDIPYVPAIEIEPEPTEEPEPEPTPEIEVPEEPEVTEAPVVEEPQEEPEIIATPVPLKNISSDTSQKIERKIRENTSENIIFTTPRMMDIGQSYTVEADVSSSFIQALSVDLPALNLENKIGLNLVGSSFDIEPIEDDSQFKTVNKDSNSIWQWNVVPKRDGINSLVLAVVIDGEWSNNEVAAGEYATFHRIIDVEPSFIYSITSSYWIMGVLIVLIIVIVAWIFLRKIRMN